MFLLHTHTFIFAKLKQFVVGLIEMMSAFTWNVFSPVLSPKCIFIWCANEGKLRCKCAKCSESVHTYSILMDAHMWMRVFDTTVGIQRLEWWHGITEQTACIQINVIGVSMKLFKARYFKKKHTHSHTSIHALNSPFAILSRCVVAHCANKIWVYFCGSGIDRIG